MKSDRRALVIFGAGASLEFGAPSTFGLTKDLEARILADPWMIRSGGDRAWTEIRRVLGDYLNGGSEAVNFEQIYHCGHELQYAFDPTTGAVNDFRPLMRPFLDRRFEADNQALRALCGRIETFIFDKMADVSAAPGLPLAALARFIADLRQTAVTRIYTTNYDDFPLQAAPDLDIGFPPSKGRTTVRFDPRHVLRAGDEDCLHHLHGSVHLGFPHRPLAEVDIGELCWFDDRERARRYASFSGSGARRMDGSQVHPSAVITGLDKLSRLQARPFASFYAALARDALLADVIYVIGAGLGDLHLNTWLHEARRSAPAPPILLVDFWPHGFVEDTAFQTDAKSTAMWHTLRMNIGYEPSNGVSQGDGWTVSKDRSCAIWDRGFAAFLDAPSSLQAVLRTLGGRDSV